MNVAVEHPADRPSALGATAGFAWSALRSVTWHETAYFLLVSLLVCALNALGGIEMLLEHGLSAKWLAMDVVSPLPIGLIVLLSWVLADRAEGLHLARTLRLALGVLLAAVVSVAAVPLLLELAGFGPINVMEYGKGETKRLPMSIVRASMGLNILLFAGLAFAVRETHLRSRRTQRALEASAQAQVALSRRLLESRLVSMQAQVEPEFLFATLIDVQALYASDASVGDATLDRLITYLRVALPRLREAGSTVGAEVQLVNAYLAVVSARHHGRPTLGIGVAPDCAGARFHPMLLLPLIQRATRVDAHPLPDHIDIRVERVGALVCVLLCVGAAGLCRNDATLARVRERLAGLYGDRVRLECREPQSGVTEFDLCLPYEFADRDRR